MKSQTIIVLTEEQTKEKVEVFKKILESDEMSKELKDKVRYFISELFEMDIEQVEVDFKILEED